MNDYNKYIPPEVINSLGGKDRIRSSDYHWLERRVGRHFLKGKEIHHEWEDGARCYILNKDVHKEIHGKALGEGGIIGL